MNLTRAVSAIEKQFGWFELSHHIESDAWGYESKNKFLNVGMAFISDLEPNDVLHILQNIEKSINPATHRNADGSYKDRMIDIDIMAVDDMVMNTPELTLPHPHLNDRPFFLEPFKELKEIMSIKQ